MIQDQPSSVDVNINTIPESWRRFEGIAQHIDSIDTGPHYLKWSFSALKAVVALHQRLAEITTTAAVDSP